ncbi:MAG: filamentous hemagglutinin N-terminal domain-containing protein, partial [Gammaproteobacteria bacterium]
MLRITKILLCAASLLLLLCRADIVTDGSLGPRTSLVGPNYEIVSDLGRRAGSNLFHSFGVFNVNTGEIATFTGDGAIDNILGRVTGGGSSNVDGQLASTIPGANLFLLNPAGILFGPNASLDIQGSFHASTADFIRLADGVRFNALPSAQDALLTTAPPETFGFLGDHPAPIEVNGSFLTVPDSKTLSLVGGDITMKNGTVFAPGGQINLISTASRGEVTPTLSGPKLEANVTSTALGKITLSRDAKSDTGIGDVDVGDNGDAGGGAVVIRGGQFVMEGASVRAQTFGDTKGVGVDIRVSSLDMHSADQGMPASIDTTTFGGPDGDGGDVYVEADTMRLSGAFPTGILAQADGEGGEG